jgi:hypothetical protein
VRHLAYRFCCICEVLSNHDDSSSTQASEFCVCPKSLQNVLIKIQKFSVLLAMACSPISLMFAVSSAQAIDFNFSANFSNGYSAQGSFTTKSNAPASSSEISPGSAPFVTQFLQSQL